MLLKKLTSKLKTLLYSVPISIKVTAWYTFFILSLLYILVGSALFISHRFIKDVNEKELVAAVHDISKMPMMHKEFRDGIFFVRYSREGKELSGTAPTGFDTLLPFSSEVQLIKTRKEDFLYLDVPVRHHSAGWIRGIFPLGRAERNVRTLLLLLYVLSPLLFCFIVYGGYKIIKNSFRPVQDISNTALEIQDSKDFSKRIPLGKGKDEIHKMASTFNQMLDILERSYLHEKQFSSDVSHELRTPITIILAESDYALQYSDSLEEAKLSLEVIQKQAKRMSSLVQQIMDLSRLEQQDKIPMQTFNLSESLQNILQDYSSTFSNKKILLQSKIEKDIYIFGNIVMIERVIDNLLSNASKFTNKIVDVHLSKGQEIILEIKDDGIGLSKIAQENIWNRFYQVNSSRNKEENQGYGLGLSLVQKILLLHNASIHVESELGKGSNFIIRF